MAHPADSELVSYDGDPVLMTPVRFDVSDAPAVVAALDAEPSLEREDRDGTRWRWSAVGASLEERVMFGWFELDETRGRLELETNSRERGERGRALVEGLAGSTVRYRTTVYEDI